MDSHKNAPLTPAGRLRLVQAVREGATIKEAAASFRVDRKTVRKWVRRFKSGAMGALADASSRPRRSPRRIARGTAQRIVVLRRRRMTMEQIARELRVSRATVSRTLARAGLSRLSSLDPAPLPRRYEHERPGELLHIDIKKLARIGGVGHRITGDRQRRWEGVGWEYAYVAIDDHSRVAYAEILPAESGHCAQLFLAHSLRYFDSLGVRVERVLTDNGKVFTSKVFAELCRQHRIKHSFTRPYRPQTNGKAERFIQTALREWAYGRAYRHSLERYGELGPWLHRYNWHRPHTAAAGASPITRLHLKRDNLLRLHT